MEKAMRIKRPMRSGNSWAAIYALVLLCPLLGQAQGDIFYSTRGADGSWARFSDLRPEAGFPGLFGNVSISGTSQPHLVGQTLDGQLWYTSRSRDRVRIIDGEVVFIPGVWQPFSNVEAQAGNPGAFFDVSISANLSTGELHVVGQTGDGNLWHTIRQPDGSWSPFWSLSLAPTLPGVFTNVSISVDSSTGELHVLGRTSDSNLWHTIRRADGSWVQFLGLGGGFADASISINSSTGELQVIGRDLTGSLWHTIRRADGSWLQFSNIFGAFAFTDVSVSADSSTGQLHVMTGSLGGFVWHTIRQTDGTWLAFDQVPFERLPFCGADTLATGLIGSILQVATVSRTDCIP